MAETVEIARSTSERGELVLRERREEGAPPVLELRANGVFVMDSAETSTEVALATAALEQADDPTDVVVGGLGLGYTLEAVLADRRVQRVRVVEIEEALIGWMRDGTVPHGRALLADPRVTLVNADIAMAVAEARSTYDLVLLDVDNGPGQLVHDGNRAIYEPGLLAGCRRMLSPGGVLAIWSAHQAPELLRSMRDEVGDAREQAHDVLLQGRSETYYLYLARRSGPGPSEGPDAPE